MKKLILALCLTGCAIGAQAQTLTISDETASSPDTQAVSINYTAGGNLADFSVRIDYDPAELTPQTNMAANPDVIGCVADVPASHTGGLTGCNNPFAGAIALSVTDQGTNTVLPTTSIGSITFDTASGLAPGTVSPIQVTFLSATTDTGATLTAGALTLNEGSITISVTPGESFFSSSPVPGSTIDFGSAVVGTATTPDETITVSNLSTDTAFNITAAAGNFAVGSGSYSLTSPSIPATVAASGSVDLDLNCTPSARGNNTGTYTITTDSDNVTSADYPTVCTGLAPNVQVSSLTQDLDVATVAGSSDADTFTVTNDNSDGFSSSTDVTISLGALSGPSGTPPTVNVSPLTFTLDPGDDQVVTSECSSDASTTPGTYTLTANVGFTAPGMIVPPEVTVECVVSEIAPGYSSTPAPNATLAFGPVANGATSAAQTIEIGNENSVGSGSAAELQITGAVLTDTTNYSFTPSSAFPITLDADAANGSASIDVTCTPESIGNFPGTLTVQTNVGDQEYDLTCEGTSNAGIAATPTVIDGTFNIGTVPPSTTTSNSITFSNVGTDPLNLTCTLTNDNAGVITSTALPNGTAIPPDFEITFDGTPPDINSFQETLDCEVDDPSTMAAPDQTFAVSVVVSGRPLVIPTMSRWGLVVMSLVLLLVAGVAGRRMLA